MLRKTPDLNAFLDVKQARVRLWTVVWQAADDVTA